MAEKRIYRLALSERLLFDGLRWNRLLGQIEGMRSGTDVLEDEAVGFYASCPFYAVYQD